MAKRSSTTRSQADDSAITTPGQPRARRARATSAPADVDTQATRGAADHPIELDPDLPERSGHADRSVSLASGSSEDDIRLRAYHRYLERGGVHGMAFDDWLEAERELKPRG
jgi:hypothetical protein